MQELYGKSIKDQYNHQKVTFFHKINILLIVNSLKKILDNRNNNVQKKNQRINNMMHNNDNNSINNRDCHSQCQTTNSIGSGISHIDEHNNNNDNHHHQNKSRFHLRRSDLTQVEKARIRTLRMTIIIVMAFVWCWTPYASIVLLFHFYKPHVENMSKDLKDALFMFAVSNSCVNPLVYGSYTMNFRQYFYHFLQRLSFWKRKTVNIPTQSERSIYLDDHSSYSGLNTSTPLYQNQNHQNNNHQQQSFDSSYHSTKYCHTDD